MYSLNIDVESNLFYNLNLKINKLVLSYVKYKLKTVNLKIIRLKTELITIIITIIFIIIGNSKSK